VAVLTKTLHRMYNRHTHFVFATYQAISADGYFTAKYSDINTNTCTVVVVTSLSLQNGYVFHSFFYFPAD